MNYKTQYEQLPHSDSKVITFDLLSIKDSQKMRIDMPVVTKKCKSHPKQCYTFIEAFNSLTTKKQFVCSCGESVNRWNDLVKDIRQLAYEQFHPIVEQVQFIQGIICHKYNRRKKYTDCLKNADKAMPGYISNLSQKYDRSNSISSMIQRDSSNQEKVNFWAYCLLDKVKIIIPVRIKTCQHPECYELSSLLVYQEQQTNKDNTNQFQCLYPKCPESLNITNIRTMIDGLVIDEELLKVINKGYPAQFKFIYDPKTKTFQDGIQIMNGVSIDPFLSKCYQVMVSPAEQKTINFIEFQQQVQNSVAQVMQCEIPDKIQKRQQKQQYITKSIDIIDPFTQDVIEFPVRCNECKEFNKCFDVRSFVADYFLAKRRNQKQHKCLICGYQYECVSKTISSLIYFDQNLISTLFLSKQYQQQRFFTYDGKQYLLDLFLTKQKVTSQEYIQNLKNSNQSMVQELSIPENNTSQIYIPLIIKNCPRKTILDFETFYNKLNENNFQADNQIISFCDCNFCTKTPKKSFYEQIYYHEALGQAFAIHQMSNLPDNKFSYNFDTKQITIINEKKNKDQPTISNAFKQLQIRSQQVKQFNLQIKQIEANGNERTYKMSNGTLGKLS